MGLMKTACGPPNSGVTISEAPSLLRPKIRSNTAGVIWSKTAPVVEASLWIVGGGQQN